MPCGKYLSKLKTLVVLASGHGTTLQAIIDAIATGKIEAQISSVISDHADSGAIQRARKHGIESEILEMAGDREAFFTSLGSMISGHNPDLIVLAGFMRIIPARIVDSLAVPIINLHPSLLPCFGGKGMYGTRVHEAVINSGARYTGCTVHFVTPAVDAGPIKVQKVLEVRDDDTPESLAERQRPLEHEAVVEAIGLVLSERYEVSGNRVVRTGL